MDDDVLGVVVVTVVSAPLRGPIVLLILKVVLEGIRDIVEAARGNK